MKKVEQRSRDGWEEVGKENIRKKNEKLKKKKEWI